MENLSLISIMRDDPDFGKRLAKKVEDIKQDKQGLLTVADQYGSKYRQEVLEGTKKRAKLLTEGAARGLTETQVMEEYGKFVPTVYTPIMNLLYFMLRETEGEDRNKYRQRDAINEVLVKTKQLNHDDNEKDLTREELNDLIDQRLKELQKEMEAEDTNAFRKGINQAIADEEREEAELKDPPMMEEYLYGKLTLDQFGKLKKLKALSRSSNENEAFQAYRKGLELCKEFGLDWDKIPCYVQKRK